jgi:hypothetical protein
MTNLAHSIGRRPDNIIEIEQNQPLEFCILILVSLLLFSKSHI